MNDTVAPQPPEAAPAPVDPALDEHFMREALALGKRGLGNAWPNPAVGAIVVKDGIVLGRGWTQPGGRPHAETQALKRAGKAADGATIYVSLEPCSHTGKTPPCADAIARAKIGRVVSAMDDPNPEVAGQGHARLREKGVQVDVGLCADEAKVLHAGHVRLRTQGRPNVTLKLAVSADGKAGGAGRKPVAITGEATRERVWQWRSQADAILVGIGTVLSDNPALTCRLPGMFERSPIRIVLDSQLKLPIASHVAATIRETPTWVFASRSASDIAAEILQDRGAKVFRVGQQKGRLDLNEVMSALAAEGITRLMVEGGPTVAASFVETDLIDEAVLLHGGNPIGPDGVNALNGMSLDALAKHLRLRESEQIGTDRADYYERV
ncbi:MAG: bifunctional diaminohydroxyphosphoribosylaminopyrimidine deaminase/5-amino-6-(5-phosphoribosylamino)uracil reductase RibD [Pseudolabrys sp.]|nr:bifunctional diaminohydroxyphosphoribosylaminopyrimidine deaminase/5-amino-6-(5-phosphoribosylamino)uracil reductase RibD [Pseudolabrys sp.]